MSSPKARPTLMERYAQERIDKVLANPATRFWLRAAITTAASMDPVDALNDSRLLFQLMQERWQAILEATGHLGSHPSVERWTE